MTEEKAYDIPKDDPEYAIKVSEVVKKRLEQERIKSVEREKAKMDVEKNKVKNNSPSTSPSPTSPASVPPNNTNNPPTAPAPDRDPEEFVKRKDIVQLVNQLNKSFAILEKHRVKFEKFVNVIAALKDE